MNVSENWLRSYLFTNPSTQEIVDTLTMGGLEVDSVNSAAPDFSAVVVGEIVNVAPHPDAEKLRICTVKGHPDQEITQVVCGAPNARVGIKVPFALVGAKLPQDVDKNGRATSFFTIKKAKLRGVESFGMLCGADELGLLDQSNSSDGIWELPLQLTTGENLRDALDLDDQIIEIDLTPNRSDCLSIQGIARDLRVLLHDSEQAANNLARPAHSLDKILPTEATHEAAFNIEIQNGAGCPLYAGRLIKNINPQAITPLWMQERLRKAGIRSISPTVDITNYVMIELGQPLHAFDTKAFGVTDDVVASATGIIPEAEVIVRSARSNESITLLNEQSLQLKSDDLLISNAGGEPLALAGIMGGASSGVLRNTKNIFLESAHFSAAELAGKARRAGLHTESSHRFERGVDPNLVKIAIERATQLIVDICSGSPGPVTIELAQALPERTISLAGSIITPKLGVSLKREQIETILQGLGIEILDRKEDTNDSSSAGVSWQLKIPSWRFDLAIDADLIEEIARVYGYNKIPSTLPVASQALGKAPESQSESISLKRFFAAKGFNEAISYSFIDERAHELFADERVRKHLDDLRLLNPISKELEVMRSSLLPGLLQVVRYNARRQKTALCFFEEGLIFQPDATNTAGKDAFDYVVGDIGQRASFAFVMAGTKPSSWQGKAEAFSFFDAKHMVESWYQHHGIVVDFRTGDLPEYLHPGQSARLYMRNSEQSSQVRELGVLGKLHPSVAKKLDLDLNCFLFEAPLVAMLKKSLTQFIPLSDQPKSVRDLSLLAPESIPYAAISEIIEKASGDGFHSVNCFDVYTGTGVPDGMKSLAVSVQFQNSTRALKDGEINQSIDNILLQLKPIGVGIR